MDAIQGEYRLLQPIQLGLALTSTLTLSLTLSLCVKKQCGPNWRNYQNMDCSLSTQFDEKFRCNWDSFYLLSNSLENISVEQTPVQPLLPVLPTYFSLLGPQSLHTDAKREAQTVFVYVWRSLWSLAMRLLFAVEPVRLLMFVSENSSLQCGATHVEGVHAGPYIFTLQFLYCTVCLRVRHLPYRTMSNTKDRDRHFTGVQNNASTVHIVALMRPKYTKHEGCCWRSGFIWTVGVV